jgi:hypothetical protein
VRWWFTDRTTGRVVIAQFPNAPLWAWIVATVAHRLTGWELLRWLATGSLVLWALLELARGASPFRRVLGAAVLGWALLA